MGDNSKIEWTTHTFNPWVGCTKISPACDHCYAESWAKRSGMVQWGPGAERRRTSIQNWNLPHKWNREAEKAGTRPRVFCASLADVFDNEVPDAWRMDLFSLIGKTPNLTWLLLTKRIGNVREYCKRDGQSFDLIGSDRVWLGATICNQEEADRDIPKLLQVPAAVRFLSIEPMLSAIDLSKWIVSNSLDEDRSQHGRHRVPSGDGRSVDRAAGRYDMEAERQKGRERPGQRVLASADHDERREGIRMLSSDRLQGVLRTDPSRTDDQSREREAVGQQAEEPDSGDVPRADTAREINSWRETERPGRREERDGETACWRCSGDSSTPESRREPAIDSRCVLGVGTGDQQDCARSTVGIHQVICGGESGPKARPMHPQWVRSLRDQCAAAGVAFFMKQLSGDRGKPIKDIALFPSDLQIREYPNANS